MKKLLFYYLLFVRCYLQVPQLLYMDLVQDLKNLEYWTGAWAVVLRLLMPFTPIQIIMYVAQPLEGYGEIYLWRSFKWDPIFDKEVTASIGAWPSKQKLIHPWFG